LLIDGGKTHLKYVKERMNLDIPCVSVSKGAKRKYGLETLHTNIGDYDFRNSEDISKLFLDVRDEAHRYALKNYRSKKRKELKKHFLLDLEGIGEKTVNKIYKEFRTLEKFLNTDVTDASKKSSISEEKVRYIQTYMKEFMFK